MAKVYASQRLIRINHLQKFFAQRQGNLSGLSITNFLGLLLMAY
jgi:hypothetical protein